MGVDIQNEQRNAFYKQAKLNGSNLREPGVLIGEARAQAGSNPYARQLLRREQGDRLKLDISKTNDLNAQTDIYTGAAEATNTVGDAFTMGAHRNLMNAAEKLGKRDYKGAAGEFIHSGARVGGSAVLNGIGQVGKGLTTLAQTSKVGSQAAKVLNVGGKVATRLGGHAPKAASETYHWGHAYQHNTQHRDLQHNALNGNHAGSTLDIKH
jgi:hypothetical protein